MKPSSVVIINIDDRAIKEPFYPGRHLIPIQKKDCALPTPSVERNALENAVAYGGQDDKSKRLRFFLLKKHGKIGATFAKLGHVAIHD